MLPNTSLQPEYVTYRPTVIELMFLATLIEKFKPIEKEASVKIGKVFNLIHLVLFMN